MVEVGVWGGGEIPLSDPLECGFWQLGFLHLPLTSRASGRSCSWLGVAVL